MSDQEKAFQLFVERTKIMMLTRKNETFTLFSSSIARPIVLVVCKHFALGDRRCPQKPKQEEDKISKAF